MVDFTKLAVTANNRYLSLLYRTDKDPEMPGGRSQSIEHQQLTRFR
jgi:hypothetical protein